MSTFPTHVINDMRAWLKDCTWADMEAGDFDDLTETQVLAGVSSFYAGGIAQFLTDARYDEAADR